MVRRFGAGDFGAAGGHLGGSHAAAAPGRHRPVTGRHRAAASGRHHAAGGHRARVALLGLALASTVAVAGIAAGAATAQAASGASPAAARLPQAPADPTGTAATTVTSGGHALQVVVTPDAGLPPSGAQITVAGKGFDPSHDLWVAVCQDDGVAPKALVNCVGGAIPQQNDTTGWGIVTDAKQSPYPGPVTTRWQPDGSFRLTLQLPSVIGESADCVSARCVVVTRSSDDTDRSEDVTVPVAFVAPPGSSSGAASQQASSSAGETTSAEPSTQTVGAVPTTVSPNSMLQTTVPDGGPQTVVFSGFEPGEKVDVTLFSDPVTLPAVTADPAGNVRISFTVPKDLPPGAHILQAIGTKSARVGIARFTVTAVTSSSTSASATSAVTSTSAAATSSAAVTVVPSTGVVTAPTTSPSATASPSTTTAPATTSSSAAAAAGTGGNRLLWLWIVLAVLVVVGGAAGIVAMVRNRRDAEDDAPVTQVAATPVPGWSGGPTAGGPGGPGMPGDPGMPGGGGVQPGGGFGLLSGREHPDGPALYSGAGWTDEPTRVIGPGQAAPPPAVQPGQASPPPAAPPAAQPGGEGPHTQQWRPDFFGDDTGDGPGDDPGDDPQGPPPDANPEPPGRHRAP